MLCISNDEDFLPSRDSTPVFSHTEDVKYEFHYGKQKRIFVYGIGTDDVNTQAWDSTNLRFCFLSWNTVQSFMILSS